MIRPLLLIAVLLVFVPGCGEGEPSGGPGPAEVRSALEAEEARLLALVQRPWLKDIHAVRGPLLQAHGAVAGILHGDLTPDALVESGRAILEKGKDPVRRTTALLETIAPVLDRIQEIERDAEAILDRLGIEDADPFPLRTAYRSGWLADRHDTLRLLMSGLVEVLEGKDETRYLIGGTNVTRVAREGAELLERLRSVGGAVLAIDDRLATLARRVAWVEGVIGEAEDRAASPSTLQDAQAVVQETRERLRAVLTEWKDLRLRYVRRPDETAADRDRVEAALDETLDTLKRRSDPLAVELGVMEPPAGR